MKLQDNGLTSAVLHLAKFPTQEGSRAIFDSCAEKRAEWDLVNNGVMAGWMGRMGGPALKIRGWILFSSPFMPGTSGLQPGERRQRIHCQRQRGLIRVVLHYAVSTYMCNH